MNRHKLSVISSLVVMFLMITFYDGGSLVVFANSDDTISINFDAVPGVLSEYHEPVEKLFQQYHNLLPTSDRFTVTAVRANDDGSWVELTIVPSYIVDLGWEVNYEPEEILKILLTQRTDGITAILPGTPEYESAHPEIPAGFASSQLSSESIQLLGTDFKFPWIAGKGWRRGALTWHTGYGDNSLDFLPNDTSNPTTNLAVLSAEAGTVSKDCDDGKQALFRINHSSGWTKYLHMDAGTVANNLIGQSIPRGRYLGLLYTGTDRSAGNCNGYSGCKFHTTCGYGTATHLHFGVSDRNWSIDGVALNTIAVSGQATYISSNQRVDDNNNQTQNCGDGEGVILYEHSNYGGRCNRLTGDDNNLSDNPIQDNAASSIKIIGSYEAIIYENNDYGGANSTYTSDDSDFGNESIGHDRASSIRVHRRDSSQGNCDGGPGAYLYENSNYSGRCFKVTGDAPNPSSWSIGNDTASSIRFVGSYEATVYQHSDYGGASSTFSTDDPDFSNDAIGNDQASSIRVRNRSSNNGSSNCDNSSGVQLYEHGNYQGRCSKFTTDTPNPSNWYLGNDAASSIRIFGNFEAVVYEHDNYNGTSSTFTGDDSDFGNDAIQHDRVSSIRVRARSTGPTNCNDNQFLAEYFNNRTLSGNPVFRQCEGQINHNWGEGGPGNGIGNDNFSVRWTGNYDFGDDAVYRFSSRTDDGVRLWVNNQLVIDQWRDMGATTYNSDQNLVAGLRPIKLEYYENGGSAVAQLSWTVQQASNNTNDDGRTIGYGDGMNGDINPAGDRDDYYFEGTAGQTITIRMEKRDSDLDSFVELYGSSGQLVGQDDDTGGNRNSRLVTTVPQNGRYKIVCHSYYTSQTGGYRLSLDRESASGADPDDNRWIAFGNALEGTIQPADDRDTYFFSATAGRVIGVRMNKIDSSLDSYLELYDSAGQKLTENDDGGGNRNSLLAWNIPSNGTYRLVARSWNLASTGRYNLSLNLAENTSGNLARGKGAYATSTEFAGVEAYKAFDGNMQTRWSSANNDPQLIYVDLGSATSFNQVVLKWETAYARQYGIYYWTGTSWQNVYWTNNGDGGTDTINLTNPVNARFVAMYGVQRGTSYGYSLWEFEIYNSDMILFPLVLPDPDDKGVETGVVPLVPLPPSDPNKGDILLVGDGETGQENMPLGENNGESPALTGNIQTGIPYAQILYPNPDQNLYVGDVTILLQGVASDNDEDGASIVQYEWQVDGNLLTDNSAIVHLNAIDLEEGRHTISFRAKDNEGIWSAWTSSNIIIEHNYMTYLPITFK